MALRCAACALSPRSLSSHPSSSGTARLNLPCALLDHQPRPPSPLHFAGIVCAAHGVCDSTMVGMVLNVPSEKDPTLFPATSSALHRRPGRRLKRPHALRLPSPRRLHPRPDNRLPSWHRAACVSRWGCRCSSKQVGVWSCLPLLLSMQFRAPSHLWRYAPASPLCPGMCEINRCVVLPMPHTSTVDTPLWSSTQALTSEQQEGRRIESTRQEPLR